MENQLPMPYPSDEPDETEREYINLDAMPDEALASLVEIELPRLIPLFGLLPDIAICPGHQPGAQHARPRPEWMRCCPMRNCTGIRPGTVSVR